jgi:uncharacterized cupredoxin-like copper-binding protein
MRPIHIAALAAMLAFSGAASSHGDEGDSKKPPAMKKEQKPWGIAGDTRAAKRTIRIVMTDNMRFSPDKVDVEQGETVKFVVKNDGQLKHEMVIGTKKELDEHAALMAKFPGMEHDEPYQVHVAPGKTGEMVWTFNRAGNFDFACLMAGHYQAGMVGKINVAKSTKVAAK